jgi:dTDP-4-dehydrorhamnose 3,5-epimerase
MTAAPNITPFEVTPTAIEGLMVLSTFRVQDDRGQVRELYRESRYSDEVPGMPGAWKQVNLTATSQGAVRGLHGEQMTKLVTIAAGAAFGAYLDARPGSPTIGQVVTVELVPGVQVLVPAGVCNGFQATAEGVSEYLYLFDEEWKPGMAGVAVTPVDPALGIEWPIAIDHQDRAQLSEKDFAAPTWAQLRATLEGAPA